PRTISPAAGWAHASCDAQQTETQESNVWQARDVSLTANASTKCARFEGDNLQEFKMSIFGNIVSAIFGHGAGSAAAPGAPAAKGTPTVAGPAAAGERNEHEQDQG